MVALSTVRSRLAATATQHPSSAFLVTLPSVAAQYGVVAGDLSYADIDARVSALTTAYAAAGYGLGHRVGLLLGNRAQFFEHWFALNALGASIVPLSLDWQRSELAYVIDHAELAAVITDEARADGVRSINGHALPIIDPDGVPPPAQRPAPGVGVPDAYTEAALLYTSGTTGRPKGCILSNDYFLRAGQWYATAGGYCTMRPAAERTLTPLPLTHMNALAFSTMAMLETGGCLALLDRFHPRQWWDCVRASRATIVHYLGVMPAMLLNLPARDDDRAHAVMFGFGAGVHPSHQAAFELRFGFPLIEAWAMTETGAGAVIAANQEPRRVGARCFGKASTAIEWRVVAEDGSDASPDQPGELRVRAAGDARRGFFSGYLKDADATAAAWQGGYFRTGDIVTVGVDGSFCFVDRRSNVIRRSGENISAVEVEAVLQQHDWVEAVGVTAVDDEVRGDEVAACIVLSERAPRQDLRALVETLVRHCLEQLAYFKAPGYVVILSALPVTPTEKILRGALKQLAATKLGCGEALDTRSMKRRSPTTAREGGAT
jgi:acyl-CoA synthetase (AMP-forming)/AMP-acid ligase II